MFYLPFSFYLNTENGDVEKSKNVDIFEDEEMRAAFESWKSKTYSLTVPLRIIALRSSVPPLWIKVSTVACFAFSYMVHMYACISFDQQIDFCIF